MCYHGVSVGDILQHSNPVTCFVGSNIVPIVSSVGSHELKSTKSMYSVTQASLVSHNTLQHLEATIINLLTSFKI
jgi:hypothetical protein